MKKLGSSAFAPNKINTAASTPKTEPNHEIPSTGHSPFVISDTNNDTPKIDEVKHIPNITINSINN